MSRKHSHGIHHLQISDVFIRTKTAAAAAVTQTKSTRILHSNIITGE